MRCFQAPMIAYIYLSSFLFLFILFLFSCTKYYCHIYDTIYFIFLFFTNSLPTYINIVIYILLMNIIMKLRRNTFILISLIINLYQLLHLRIDKYEQCQLIHISCFFVVSESNLSAKKRVMMFEFMLLIYQGLILHTKCMKCSNTYL